MIDDVSRIRKALNDKGAKYADLDKPLDWPLIIAVQCRSTFVGVDELVNALYGSIAYSFYQDDPREGEWIRERNGYWREGPPPRGSRVSAVLGGLNIRYWDIATKLPTLFLNPWASTRLTGTDTFATVEASDSGQIVSTVGQLSAPTLLEIPDNWPWMDEKI